MISSHILGTYQPGQFIFQCLIFLPVHAVHGVPKERILKGFTIPISSRLDFARTLGRRLPKIASNFSGGGGLGRPGLPRGSRAVPSPSSGATWLSWEQGDRPSPGLSGDPVKGQGQDLLWPRLLRRTWLEHPEQRLFGQRDPACPLCVQRLMSTAHGVKASLMPHVGCFLIHGQATHWCLTLARTDLNPGPTYTLKPGRDWLQTSGTDWPWTHPWCYST